MPATALERCLHLLRCPLTAAPLSRLSAEEIADLNQLLSAGEWLHRDGSKAATPLEAALGTLDRQLAYREDRGIIWLLGDLVFLPASRVTGPELRPEKRIVRAFYDEYGWVKDSEGVFNDTAEFTEARPGVEGYRRKCNLRIGKYFPGGEVLLDVASGAIPHAEYLDFSAHYGTRLCVDFSVRALREAQQKLGDRGLYVIGDITRLPLATGSIDGVISLHTIYHVPQAEQTAAVDELVRVTRPGGRVVIAYVWDRSCAMDAIFRVRGWLGRLRRMGRPSLVAIAPPARSTAMPELYFHPQDYAWYAREVATRHRAKLRVWSAVSTAFQNRFFTDGRLGRIAIRLVVVLETVFPWLAGRFGQYPLFVIETRSD